MSVQAYTEKGREGGKDGQTDRGGRKYPCKELRTRSYHPPKTSNHSGSKRTEKIYDELSKELRKLFLSGVMSSVEYYIGLDKNN